jgi:sugar transferase (PEP-CTERM system associated)
MAIFRISRIRALVYFAFELALVAAVILVLAQATLAAQTGGAERLPLATVLVLSALFGAALFGTQSANLGDDSSVRRELVVFAAVSIVLGLVCYTTVRVFTLGEPVPFAAWLALEAAVAVPLAIAGWRRFSARRNLFNALRERVLILGTGEAACQACRWIMRDHAAEYGVIGFADEAEERLGTVLAMGVRIQTGYGSLPEFCAGRVERVVVALDEKRGRLPVRQLMELRLRGVAIEEATSFFERNSGKIAVETMLPSWLIFSEGFRTTRLKMALKRFVDISHAVALLLVTFPLMLLTAALIRIDSSGPILYRQERLGHNGRRFDVLKFRSMVREAERMSGPALAVKGDPRITRVGRVIRKLRIDELPQLFNVLRGEMSFVGPRPEREHFARRLEETIPYFGLRLIVRPGLTGWAQVQSGYADNTEGMLEKLKYDLYYIKNHNLLLDLWIVLKTVRVVLAGSGAQ